MPILENHIRELNITYRWLALFMAFLMFFTSLGIPLDVHYCQGYLKSFSFFGKAKSCYQLIDAESTRECTAQRLPNKTKKASNTCSVQKEDCCHSQLLRLLSDQDQNIQLSNCVANQKLSYFASTLNPFILAGSAFVKNEINLTRYKPPIISRDIYVLLERLLL